MGASVSIPTSKFKDEADQAYNEERYYDAILYYTLAINHEYSLISNTEDEDEEIIINYDNLESINYQLSKKDKLSKLFSNRSSSLLLLNQPSRSLEDALVCIEINPTWFKGYYRATKAYYELGKFDEARLFIEKALLLKPDDDTLLKLYQEVQKDDIKKVDNKLGIGHVYSWGSGKNGMLGHGDQKDKNFPTSVDTLKEQHIVDVSCAASHTVFLTANGVYVCGNNTYGQLGIGKGYDENVLTPILIPKLFGIKINSVSCGGGHTVALSTSCCYGFGINRNGQLGLGNDLAQNYTEPQIISSLNQKEPVAVSCGLAHTFFLLKSGALLATGLNQYGQLGIGSNTAQSIWTPLEVQIEGGKKIVHVSSGGVHTLVIDEDNRIFGTGSNSCSQLGMECGDLNAFKRISTLSTTKAAFVSCGEEFSCMISTSRSVYVWGLCLSSEGELSTSSIPKRIDELEGMGIESLSCSQKQIMAISWCGDVWKWGIEDEYPTIGIDASSAKVTPEKMSSFGKSKRIRLLSCGRKHFACCTIGAYGPFSYVSKGLEELTEVSSDTKLKFQIKSIDMNGVEMNTGGYIYRIKVDHDLWDYDYKIKKLLDANNDMIKKRVDETCTIDDNFDGTYDCTVNLLVAGNYRLKISHCGLEVKGSPFEVEVVPGKLFPPYCIPWWGRFLCRNSMFEGNLKLNCNVDDGCVFTVSCYDRYGNKCMTSSSFVIITCESENDDDNYKSRQIWKDSSNSIFPCVLNAPSKVGIYRVKVFVDNDDNNDNQVKGSPFVLTVNPKIIVSDGTTTIVGENNINDQQQLNGNDSDCNSNNEAEEKQIQLSKMDMTRKRAEDALRKKRNLLKFEREMKMKEKSVKRTGGGFIIKYSSDI